MNVLPAGNIVAGAFGGIIAAVAEHFLAAHGIQLPPDVADALPGAFAVLIAHAYDMATGGNLPRTLSPEQLSQLQQSLLAQQSAPLSQAQKSQ